MTRAMPQRRSSSGEKPDASVPRGETLARSTAPLPPKERKYWLAVVIRSALVGSITLAVLLLFVKNDTIFPIFVGCWLICAFWITLTVLWRLAQVARVLAITIIMILVER